MGIGSQYSSALAAVSSTGTAYTADQVYQLMLRSGQESFTFDWLNQDRVYQGDLTPWVLAETVPRLAYDSTAAVQRSLRFQTLGMPSRLDPLRDLVRPHYRLLAPDGGWLDWTLGTLLLNLPRKTISEGHSLYDWTATDVSDLLVQDEFLESFSVAGDAMTAVRAILAGLKGPPLPTLLLAGAGVNRALNLRGQLSWDRGKSRLEAINAIQAAVGYRPIWCDELGQLRSQQIPDYNFETPAGTWDARSGQSVVISAPQVEEADQSALVNTAVAVSENATVGPPIYAIYENIRSDSPVSVARLKRRRVKEIRDPAIADQYSAQLSAMAAVQEGARTYAKFTLSTVHWPVWQNYDLLHYIYSSTDEGTVDANYLVLGWSMEMTAGGTTTHTLQRVLPA